MHFKKVFLALGIAVAPLAAQAGPCEIQDNIEDKVEAVGGFIERNWEKLEDAVIPETEEERREEAQERAEDAAEEAAEEERCRNQK